MGDCDDKAKWKESKNSKKIIKTQGLSEEQEAFQTHWDLYEVVNATALSGDTPDVLKWNVYRKVMVEPNEEIEDCPRGPDCRAFGNKRRGGMWLWLIVVRNDLRLRS